MMPTSFDTIEIADTNEKWAWHATTNAGTYILQCFGCRENPEFYM
jgi:hypothetical protein